MDKENKRKVELDCHRIVNHFLRKFFNFFKLPEFLPKKWLKKYKRLLKSIFDLREKLEEDIRAKDEKLEDLNIVEWVNAIENYIKQLKELLSELTNIDEENKRLVTDTFDTAIDDLDNTLKGILEMQESFPWYTGDGTNPVCFININSVNNSKVLVNGVTYTTGVIFIELSQTVTITITPNDGYQAETGDTPSISGYIGSVNWSLISGAYRASLTLTEDYTGSTIYIGYNPTAVTYTTTIISNVKNAYAFIGGNPFTTATITLPYALNLSIEDYDGFGRGETPSITNYTGSAKWYLSGDSYKFSDTIGTEYADKTLTVNYTAVEKQECSIVVNDISGGYETYINGEQTNTMFIEKGTNITIIVYLLDGYESTETPIVEGIDMSLVTILSIVDEDIQVLMGYNISFNSGDITDSTATVQLYSAGSIGANEIRITWNDNNIYLVEVD